MPAATISHRCPRFVLVVALVATSSRAMAQTPQRDIRDPGVIATDQRVTPAGVQSVFDGRVTGVRFGKKAGELWVAAANGAYRIAWQDNRVIASNRIDGRGGVHGVAIDPTTGNALVSS